MTHPQVTSILPADQPQGLIDAAKRLYAYFQFLSENNSLKMICTLELIKSVGVPPTDHQFEPAADVVRTVSRIAASESDPAQNLDSFIGHYPNIVRIANLIRGYTGGGSQFV